MNFLRILQKVSGFWGYGRLESVVNYSLLIKRFLIKPSAKVVGLYYIDK